MTTATEKTTFVQFDSEGNQVGKFLNPEASSNHFDPSNIWVKVTLTGGVDPEYFLICCKHLDTAHEIFINHPDFPNWLRVEDFELDDYQPEDLLTDYRGRPVDIFDHVEFERVYLDTLDFWTE